MELNKLTIKQARIKLDKHEITSLDLTKACLARLAEINEKLNVCITICGDEALAAAEAADARINAGEKGDLLGIPFLAKDNILTKNIRTTAASKMLANYVAPYDATVIIKLKEAGAVLLGKTNLDEFAHGASTEYSYFGATKNPYDLERVPGGSSGGSAAAVAAHGCLFALGTDTGGSIRHPASFCGVVGLKPTYGACSRFGLIAMTSSTDVPGPLAKTSADAKLILKTIAGADDHDLTTDDYFKNSKIYKLKNKKNLEGLRVGLVREFNNNLDAKISYQVNQAIAELKKLGAEIVDINLSHVKYAVSSYYIITPSEVSSNLARFDGLRYGLKNPEEDLAKHYLQVRGEGFGPEAKRRIMLGTYALSAGYHDAYYVKAQTVRTKIINDFAEAFKQVDVIAMPATVSTAFRLGGQDQDPLKMYLEDIFLAPASLAGLPAVCLPGGAVNNLPIGWQLIGPKFSDDFILSVGEVYEAAAKHEKLNLKI